jgi:DNA-directed RNA polymerase specialized sigma24 family protein
MTFFKRYGAEAVLQTVRYYFTCNPGRARKARSVGLDNVVQETMVNLLRYPPKKDVLLSNGCYWTASYTLKRMLARRRPVRPAGLFYDMPEESEDGLEELWDVIRRELPSAYDVLFRYFHGETQKSIAKRYGVHQSIIHTRIQKWLRVLRGLEPSRAIHFFITGEGYVRS